MTTKKKLSSKRKAGKRSPVTTVPGELPDDPHAIINPPRPAPDLRIESLLDRLLSLEYDFAARVLDGDSGQQLLAILRGVNVALRMGDHEWLADTERSARRQLYKHGWRLPNVPKATLLTAMARAATKACGGEPADVADAILRTLVVYPSTQMREWEAEIGDRVDVAKLRHDPQLQTEALHVMAAALAPKLATTRDGETLVRHALAALLGVPVSHGKIKELYAAHDRRAKRRSSGS